MLQVLSQYKQDDMIVTEYTKDSETVSHVVKTPIVTEVQEPAKTQLTLEEITMQTQLNTEYLVCLAELNNM